MSSKTELRTPKPPKPPEKPLMPYMRYSKKVWEQVKNSNPHLKLWEVGKIIGQMWRELPDEEKALYIEEYDTEKSLYTEALRQYHSSPAYQAWLVAKERTEKLIEEHDQERKQSVTRSRDRSADITQTDLRESYILEDNEEDTEDQYTAKHVAAARFQRNHRLMQEILSDSRLPDPGQLITQSRLNTLRSQVKQLKNHKRNLCHEIECCESRHRSKLQRIQEDSDKFVSEYQKLTATRPMITESQFADMIIKAKVDLQHEEEERLSRFLAEAEARRRKQRQQREAELSAEAERRRLQQQQQQIMQIRTSQTQRPDAPIHHQSNSRGADGPLIQEPKSDQHVQGAPKSPTSMSINMHASKSGAISSDSLNQMTSTPYPIGMATSVSTTSQRPPQIGHTQHHYPPPPNYPPSAISPSCAQPIGFPSRGQTPFPQSVGVPGLVKSTPPAQTKKTPSSGSSNSSSSSSSSSASIKRKKSDDDDNPHERKVDPTLNGVPSCVIVDRRSVSDENGTSRSGEFIVSSAASAEYLQGSSIQSVKGRHPASQQYSSVTQTCAVPSGGIAIGPPSSVTSQPPFSFEHNAPSGSVISGPGGSYYHPTSMTQSSTHPPGFSLQTRPQFGHSGYVSSQYAAPVPHQSTEHPPPPPVYVQHVTQQAQPPHLAQQGPMIMGSPSAHPMHPHQGSPIGWHPPGHSAYPPAQYGPPRYIGPSGPVGYTATHQVRHLPSSGGAYGVHSYPGIHQHPHQAPTQQPPPTVSSAVSETGASGQQPIPAPPPYQQQQQQHGNVPSGYWAAPHPSSEYGGPNQTSPYVSTPHPEVPGPLHAPSLEVTSLPGHAHPEPTSHPVQQPHHSAVYYPGYSHPVHSSYGPPGNMPPSGFYNMPPQHQSNQYTHGTWSGYPPTHPHNYQQHPHMHHSQQQPSNTPPLSGSAAPANVPVPSKGDGASGASTLEIPVAGPTSGSSRPPSVSS